MTPGVNFGYGSPSASSDLDVRPGSPLYIAADASGCLPDTRRDISQFLRTVTRGPDIALDVAAAVHPDLIDKIGSTAARLSDVMAVEASDGNFTYRELDLVSNQIANFLLKAGVKRETRVGVSLRRGAAELLSFLGILKAGGTYVPLDPTHPFDRLADCLADADPEVLIVNPGSRLKDLVPSTCKVVEVDDPRSIAQGESADCPPHVPAATDLAYILFTSGSTGRPKGVEVSRDALSNLLGSMARVPGMSEHERLLAVTTTSFDIAALELFLPLCVGGTAVIMDESSRSIKRLSELLATKSISMMQTTPSTLRRLFETGWPGDRKLRILCGGEALTAALADRLLATCGELWNVYGPTETTVWSTVQKIEPGYDAITIGHAIDDTQIYVLGPDLEEVAAGEEGEICIGGRGVARGYRNRPDLTAERFVTSPSHPERGVVYKTGDLGRMLPDGRLVCLGRLDHQVKIGGVRIELGEIEAVIRAVEGVDETVVTAHAKNEGDSALIAYWAGTATRQQIIEKVKECLHVVISHYIHLDEFPLNTNGKIDRKLLPLPDIELVEVAAEKRPRSDAEVRVAVVWQDVLGVPEVPFDESFFTIGGSSLTAVQVIVRLEKEFGVEVSLQSFYEAPTVQALTSNLGKSVPADAPIAVRLRPGRLPVEPPIFCLMGVHLYQDLALALKRGPAVYGLHVPMKYSKGFDAYPPLRDIALRYIDLIRQHQSQGPYRLLGFCFGGIIAYCVAAELEAQGETVLDVTVLDGYLPGAVSVNVKDYVAGRIGQFIGGGPSELRRLLDRGFSRVRSKLAARYSVTSSAVDVSDARISADADVDGPDVDRAVNAYVAVAKPIRAKLLVVKAAQQPHKPWVRLDPHFGWKARASDVLVHEVSGDHLQILKGANARSIAGFVDAGRSDCSRLCAGV